jgi:hypothetical protein
VLAAGLVADDGGYTQHSVSGQTNEPGQNGDEKPMTDGDRIDARRARHAKQNGDPVALSDPDEFLDMRERIENDRSLDMRRRKRRTS